MYLDGEPFILDVTIGLLTKDLCLDLPEILLVPLDDEDPFCTYSSVTEYEWQREDCDNQVLQLTLETLGIPKTAPQVLREMATYF